MRYQRMLLLLSMLACAMVPAGCERYPDAIDVPEDLAGAGIGVLGFGALHGGRYIIALEQRALVYDRSTGWEHAPLAATAKAPLYRSSGPWQAGEVSIAVRAGRLVRRPQGLDDWTPVLLENGDSPPVLVDATFQANWPRHSGAREPLVDGNASGYAISGNGMLWRILLDEDRRRAALRPTASLAAGWEPLALSRAPGGPVAVLARRDEQMSIFLFQRR